MELKDIFDQYDVEYWENGKNVTQGWINIQCIYCGDNSNHLGIRLSDLKCSCWKCGPKSFASTLQRLTKLSYKQIEELIKNIETSSEVIYQPKEKKKIKRVLPSDISKEFPKRHLKYLKGRGLNPREIITTYDLYASTINKRYPFRIIIPVKMEKQIVTFTSRDITGLQKEKYKSASNAESIIEIKNTIYNYDMIKPNHDVFICEGPADTWKIGFGAISFFGVSITDSQLNYLWKKRIKTAYIILDNDKTGRREADNFARLISPVVNNVKMLNLKKVKDPGELSNDFFKRLKRELQFDY